ncbi:MAG: hypothetical protein IT383_20555 [Deltaproteobacteria bacterium]|nr:hypothetical protein [Deltaproteobacteria bacterium]
MHGPDPLHGPAEPDASPAASLARPLSVDEQAAVLDALARVIRELGVERVLTRPVVLPDERHFPDPWDGSALGVARLLRRLMRFAHTELCPLLVSSEALVSTHLTAAWLSRTWTSAGSAVRLAGVTSNGLDGGAGLAFAVDLEHLHDPDVVVGACAREVARACRVLAGVADEDPAMEERLVDLSAVALGFGVLVANTAHRVRSRGGLEGNVTWSVHTRVEAGASSPRELALALGALVAARHLDVRPLRAALETNQGAWFAEAAAAHRSSAAARLGLPASAGAPAHLRLDELLAPLSDEGLHVDAMATVEAETVERDGPPVFCVQENQLLRGSTIGGVGGILAAAVGAGVVSASPVLRVALFVGALGLGVGLGASLRTWACASCEARLPDLAPDPVGQRCPGCGGRVVGRVAHRDHRLQAEEDWRRERAGRS